MLPALKTLLITGLLIVPATAISQTLGFYGGAGVSYDGFIPDKEITRLGASRPFLAGPMAIMGLRYHTLQNFDITLDATLGISSIQLPLPAGTPAKLYYEQITSLVLAGSGLNIPLANGQNLMPSIQIGAGFFDFWDFVSEENKTLTSHHADYKTNRWAVVCGAGIDYQFKLFLSSGINLRAIYTPLDLFQDPLPYSFSNLQGTTDMQLQGKLLQLQLTYRVNLPLYKWKND